MAWQDALQDAPGGCRILVEAHPGTSRDRFPDGYNAWRGRLKVAVMAPAAEGAANDAICAVVAHTLGVQRARVRIEQGAKDRRKTVAVDALDWAAAVAILEAYL